MNSLPIKPSEDLVDIRLIVICPSEILENVRGSWRRITENWNTFEIWTRWIKDGNWNSSCIPLPIKYWSYPHRRDWIDSRLFYDK
jgi:hypothetical protein